MVVPLQDNRLGEDTAAGKGNAGGNGQSPSSRRFLANERRLQTKLCDDCLWPRAVLPEPPESGPLNIAARPKADQVPSPQSPRNLSLSFLDRNHTRSLRRGMRRRECCTRSLCTLLFAAVSSQCARC